MTNIAIEELKTLCLQLLTKNNIRAQDAEIITAHLMENECSGKASHGMVRLPQIIRAIQKNGVSNKDPEIILDQGNIAVLEANGQIGVVAGQFVVGEAIRRVMDHGLVMIGVRNYIATSGSMAHYLKQFVETGLIAIMGCNSVAMVAPPTGRERMIGTNPVGIAIPAQHNDGMIADLATSAIAYGKIMVMNERGQDIPEGLLLDKDGKPSANPKDAYEGAILPLAGHKGFSLGLMVELLAGPLLSAKAIKKDDFNSDGLFAIVIDPKKFGNSEFYEQVSQALEQIRKSPPREGYNEVTIAGDRSRTLLNENKAAGKITVADKTLEDIKRLLTRENRHVAA